MVRIEVERADSGNQFLCHNCIHAFIRNKGRSDESIQCKKLGKTVQNVKPDADSLWAPPGSWDIVYEQSYADSKNLLVIKQDPQPGTGLTAGQLMHLYVDGSGGFVWYKDPRILWGIIAIEFVVIIVLVIRCRGGGGLAGSKTA